MKRILDDLDPRTLRWAARAIVREATVVEADAVRFRIERSPTLADEKIAVALRCQAKTLCALATRIERRRSRGEIAAKDAEIADLRVELQHVLDDWNALVKASGSPTNGAAVGYVARTVAQLSAAQAETARLHALLLAANKDADARDAEIATLRKDVAELREALEPMVRGAECGERRGYMAPHRGCRCGRCRVAENGRKILSRTDPTKVKP